MPNDTYEAGQDVVVTHTDAQNNRVAYRAKVVQRVDNDTWQVEVPALGLIVHADEKDIVDGR